VEEKSLPLSTTDSRKYDDRELRRLQRDSNKGMPCGSVVVAASLPSVTQDGLELSGIMVVEHPLQMSHGAPAVLLQQYGVRRRNTHRSFRVSSSSSASYAVSPTILHNKKVGEGRRGVYTPHTDSTVFFEN
jgi:hypothetical protein